MKALFISNDPLIFDEGSAVRARLRTYAHAIGDLHVVSRAPQDAVPTAEAGLFLHPIIAAKPFHLVPMIAQARALIQAVGIEVVSAQDPFEHGLIALLAALGTQASLHIQIHTDILSPFFMRDSLKNRLRILIAALTLRKARGIRVVSNRIKISLQKRYGRGIIEPAVIPVSIPAVIPPSEALPRNSFMFTLVAVARLEREKRVGDILAALVLVRRKYPETGLFVIGDGSRKAALMRQAHALGLGEHVVFMGARWTDAVSLMQGAQAFVQASAYEGYGLTLLESALAGVPIVTTDVGIVGDVLIADESALVSPVGDVYALAANIMRLIEKNDLRETLSMRARESAERHRAQYPDQPALIAGDLARALLPR